MLRATMSHGVTQANGVANDAPFDAACRVTHISRRVVCECVDSLSSCWRCSRSREWRATAASGWIILEILLLVHHRLYLLDI
jgi:hypothetical protein